MALIEVGRICIKKFGRDAGSRAIITKLMEGPFVEIVSSVRTKPRKCNISHLEFLNDKADVKDKAAIAKALEIKEDKVKA